jgi:ribonuclease G
MAFDIVIDEADGFRRIAVWQGRTLVDIYAENLLRPECAGAVLSGKIMRLQKTTQTAYVDMGLPRNGVVETTRLLPGDTGLFQIKTPPDEKRGAELQSDITLPGRFLIYRPFGKGLLFSKSLAAAEKDKLSALWKTELATYAGGWIIREAAAAVRVELIRNEINFLVAEAAMLPRATGFGILRKVLTDLSAKPYRLVTGTPAMMKMIQAELSAFAPDLVHHIDYEPDGWAEQTADILDHIQEKEVALPSGGTIIIEPTAALVAIDINQGQDNEIFRVNSEAMRAIAAEIRWRHLGGIIVIDTIGMKAATKRNQLLTQLRAAVAGDPESVQVFGMTKLGLIEMTRRRSGRPLATILAEAS